MKVWMIFNTRNFNRIPKPRGVFSCKDAAIKYIKGAALSERYWLETEQEGEKYFLSIEVELNIIIPDNADYYYGLSMENA